MKILAPLCKNLSLYISYDGMTDPLGEAQVIPYLEGLSLRGYRFILLSYEKPDRYKKRGADIRERLSNSGIEWKPLRYHKRFSILSTSYDLLRGFFVLSKLIPQKKIQIIHCRSYIASILGLVFKKIYRTKFIFDMRGFWADERLEGGIFKSKTLYAIFKKLEKIFIKNADATISLTKNAINEMKSWSYVGSRELRTMHHITTCCSLASFDSAFDARLKRQLDSERLQFVYLGSVGPWHSFPEISGILKAAYELYPQAHFHMIIDLGQELMEEHLQKAGYDQSRFSLMRLPHREIPKVLAKADIGFFVIPPVYAKKSSSPTKMGELLAAGIPILTGHSIGDVDELVEENALGYVMKNFSEEEYKKGIQSVVKMVEENRVSLARRCRGVAESYFSMDLGLEKLDGIYQSLSR